MNLTSVIGRTALIVISVFLNPLEAGSYGPFKLQDFQTRAAFELVVNDSKPLTPGAGRLATQSAYVTLAHGLAPGNSDGLEIQFFPKPITEEVKADILENDAKESKKAGYAALVLFIGKDKKVWQANLSYVVPGTTVARTVAWKPDELQKYFSDYSFDGKRLGVEFTEFHLPAGPGERPHQEVQSLQEQVIAIAEDAHASAGGPALYVHAIFGRHGWLAKHTVRQIGEAVADALLSYPVPRSRGAESVEIPRALLPREIAHVHVHGSVHGSVDGVDRLWQCGYGSWVAPLTASHIQTEIDRKRRKASLARRKCERLWLVIVQDLSTEAHACELTDAARLGPYQHPFDRLLWLEPHAPSAVDLGCVVV